MFDDSLWVRTDQSIDVMSNIAPGSGPDPGAFPDRTRAPAVLLILIGKSPTAAVAENRSIARPLQGDGQSNLEIVIRMMPS